MYDEDMPDGAFLPDEDAPEFHLPPSPIISRPVRGPLIPPLTKAEVWGTSKHASHLKTPKELLQRAQARGEAEHILQGIFRVGDIVMLGGDSTIGKTPFLLQMGLCIATGVPFLHIPTRRAKVLHIDLENSDKDLGEKVLAMAEGLGLKEIPAHFMALAAMGTEEWDEPGYKLEDYIRKIQPEVVVIDTMMAWRSDFIDKENGAKHINRIRNAIKKYRFAFIGVHHTRKPSDDPQYGTPTLDEARPMTAWFNEWVGSKRIFNLTDVRLGLDRPGETTLESISERVEVVFGGVVKLGNTIPIRYLYRKRDEAGEPLCYGRLKGLAECTLGARTAYKKILAKLDEKARNWFTTKEARQWLLISDTAFRPHLQQLVAADLVKAGEKRGVWLATPE